jgi:sulfur-oxidizing protein SoxB
MTLGGKPVEAGRRYVVAGWAPVSEEARAAGGEPAWELVARYLRRHRAITPRMPNLPEVIGIAGNAGMA